jgi:DNA recombination protein RmuC
MFEIAALVLILIVLIGFYILFKKISSLKESSTDRNLIEWLKTMQNSLDSSTGNMVKTLQENSRQLNDRLDKAAIAVRDVEKEVGRMSEIGRSMQELQEFLKSPKLRGNIGEYVLKDVISQMFPKNSFFMQYAFRSGEKVDAAIKTDAGILPIDSKFPMENFQKMLKAKEDKERDIAEKDFTRDVKRHIQSIAGKYILPGEGTMDFALMYLPSESIYYEVVNNSELMELARECRVYPVSPSTLYAHLQTILLSFEGRKIEATSRQIFTVLRSLQIDYKKVNENVTVLGKHLNNASSQFNNVLISFSSLGEKIQATQQLEEKASKK